MAVHEPSEAWKDAAWQVRGSRAVREPAGRLEMGSAATVMGRANASECRGARADGARLESAWASRGRRTAVGAASAE
eukprot:3652650-Pleurochrysis_carterae.AAC.1